VPHQCSLLKRLNYFLVFLGFSTHFLATRLLFFFILGIHSSSYPYSLTPGCCLLLASFTPSLLYIHVPFVTPLFSFHHRRSMRSFRRVRYAPLFPAMYHIHIGRTVLNLCDPRNPMHESLSYRRFYFTASSRYIFIMLLETGRCLQIFF